MKKLIILFVLMGAFCANQVEARGRIINKTGNYIYAQWKGLSERTAIPSNGTLNIPDIAQVFISESNPAGAFDIAGNSGYTINNPKAVDYVVTFDKKDPFRHQFVVSELKKLVGSSQ